ncbi:MAG: hypothetical protein E6I96_07040 [Chloroflexi bacterium]|nr:MAG: hypothetical protein E6I96_07040 [Chloroflexota bacterium]
MIALANRVHLYAHPRVKDELVRVFEDSLGCAAALSTNAPGLAEPILAWNFPRGGSLSVEFTAEALDERQARHGAWLEFLAEDPRAITSRLEMVGLTTVEYLGRQYFVLPGGQVVRIAPAS